ncbi:Yip1 domain-containing protein [Dictyostelium discoideum AX4]|uniref:Protein YIPF5 homolog n=1 Tax=Dictyostelium discoideum TaxID=44689 RepID=YIPF5_DICDI|nr:Yip1 domain-containing protein [Dictyostelium discoideum AX4]Q54QY3.1 RecName: Full=Protein YIPF5 homolog [Dictyostelium discoideum]EAL65648.1 Yip1 domain-containing protein [Dictyostelium discoideum AX4]|eukprot:XP_639001.1 Yip1 domain-containing protein [Dictyostelium discoideum AX4]
MNNNNSFNFIDSQYSTPQGAYYDNTGRMGGGGGMGGPTDSFDNELPLLEELGINFDHIRSKTLSVLNPLKKIDSHIMDDTDLGGPILFGLLLGFSLLMSGKIQFGYIYGLGLIGCVSMYIVLNLMSEKGIDIYRVISVLGYCLLPMIFLSFTSLIININGMVGYILIGFAIVWSTYSASKMFVKVLSMIDQRILVAYPVGLLYTGFALITAF